MNKKVLAIVFALVFLSVLPISFAGLKVVPTCRGTGPTYGAGIVRTEYRCGDCSRGWTQECRTLYRIDYLSDGRTLKCGVTRPQTDYVYCYNGKFVKINWSERFECRGNKSYSIQKAKLPRSFRWSYEHRIPKYCAYGCNPRTGKCNEAPRFRAPAYKWECIGNYRVKIDIRCGNILEREYCPYGCTNGKCNEAPRFQRPRYIWKCKRGGGGFWYSVYYDRVLKKEVSRERCKWGCNRSTGRCREKRCTPRNYTFCKPSDPKRVYIKYVYSNCSSREFLYMTCGSCQRCSRGKCVGPTIGYRTPVRSPKTVPPKTTSNYGQIYSPSSGWKCVGSFKVPFDMYGQIINSRKQYCPHGCHNGSCIQPKNQCTYNSDCPHGYYCAHLSNRNECRRRG